MITRKPLRQANAEKFESLTDADIDRVIAEDPELAPPTQSLAPLLDMRDIRRKLGLTQAQLAKKLHVAVATLQIGSTPAARPIPPPCRRCCGFSTSSPSPRSAPSTNRREERDNGGTRCRPAHPKTFAERAAAMASAFLAAASRLRIRASMLSTCSAKAPWRVRGGARTLIPVTSL